MMLVRSLIAASTPSSPRPVQSELAGKLNRFGLREGGIQLLQSSPNGERLHLRSFRRHEGRSWISASRSSSASSYGSSVTLGRI